MNTQITSVLLASILTAFAFAPFAEGAIPHGFPGTPQVRQVCQASTMVGIFPGPAGVTCVAVEVTSKAKWCTEVRGGNSTHPLYYSCLLEMSWIFHAGYVGNPLDQFIGKFKVENRELENRTLFWIPPAEVWMDPPAVRMPAGLTPGLQYFEIQGDQPRNMTAKLCILYAGASTCTDWPLLPVGPNQS